MSKKFLKVGDQVEKIGHGVPSKVDGFGIARVETIDLFRPGQKEGAKRVKEVSWDVLEKNPDSVIVDLDNGHWARGSQLKRVENEYDWITDEMFDQKLREMVDEDNTASGLMLSVPGVYELVKENYTNDVLAALEEEREIEKVDDEELLEDPGMKKQIAKIENIVKK